MAFCPNCGSEVVNGAKFCQKCGFPLSATHIQQSATRQHEFVGKVYKCPNCGQPLKSFTIHCPACGLELRGAKATSSVREFALKLEAIESRRVDELPAGGVLERAIQAQQISKTDSQKISLIHNFSVPNTKEDILEFMILATSNIDPSIYGTTDNPPAGAKAMADAWRSKIKQTYAKAKSAYGADPDFKKIQELYDSCYTEIGGQKKKKILKWVLLIAWIPLLWGGIIVYSNISEQKDEAKEIERLESVVVDIQNALANNEYELALMYADSIDYQRKDAGHERHWDIQRLYWIDKVLRVAEEAGVVIEYTVAPDGSDVDNANTPTAPATNTPKGFVGGFVDGLANSAQSALEQAQENIEKIDETLPGIGWNNKGENDASTDNIAHPSNSQDIDYENVRIEKGSVYSCMVDKWKLFVVTAISDKVIKIDCWERKLATDKDVQFDYEVGSLKITDSKNKFTWIDDDCTVFKLSFIDENDGDRLFPKTYELVFTVLLGDSNVNKGSNYDGHEVCYQHREDDWNIYKAFNITDKLIKIENWYRHIKVGGFYYGYDVCIIDLDSTDGDFEWADEEHSAFTITLQDKENSSLKKGKFVTFLLE